MNLSTIEKYELEAKFDGRKSFYKKAYVEIEGDESRLLSYGTHVASVWSGITGSTDELRVFGTYSATTLRHIKEFMLQFGFPGMNKKAIEDSVMGKRINRAELWEIVESKRVKK